jgi:hypothetical protein
VTHDIATYAAILMDGNTITNLLKNKIALRRFSARFSCGLSLSTPGMTSPHRIANRNTDQ